MEKRRVIRLSPMERQLAWDRWIAGQLGHRVQVEERRLARKELRRLFGKTVVQIGGSSRFPLIADSLAPVRLQVMTGTEHPAHSHCPTLHSELSLLPLPTESIDIVVLQHTLELTEEPHQLLREVERILKPGGRLLVFGFNPQSSWGMRRLVSTRLDSVVPWQFKYFSVGRVEDWCRLLGLEPELTRYAVFSLPFAKRLLRRAFKGIEHRLARREWPIGAVYCLRTKKDRFGLIQPSRNPLARLSAVRPLRPAAGIGRSRIGVARVSSTESRHPNS